MADRSSQLFGGKKKRAAAEAATLPSCQTSQTRSPQVHLPGIYLLVASTAAATAAISVPVPEAADQQQNPQPVIAASAAITGKTASTAISVIAHAADQENQEDQVTAVIIAIIGTATAISTIGSS